MAKSGRGLFQSTLPSRGATKQPRPLRPHPPVSIHAPLARSDVPRNAPGATFSRFQSTLPSRGATPMCKQTSARITGFNPRSPREERQQQCRHAGGGVPVSIHAPLARSDHRAAVSPRMRPSFQSTLPSRGATKQRDGRRHDGVVSIHAPLARSDAADLFDDLARANVSIHAPLARSDGHGGVLRRERRQFQSTLPSRGAT